MSDPAQFSDAQFSGALSSAVAPVLTTARLTLRQWRESDLAPFAESNADGQTMAYFPRLLSRRESDALARRIAEAWATDGISPWAVEETESGRFVGFVGLIRIGFPVAFEPKVELAWHLHRAFWGKGYATEAAQAALRYAFDVMGLPAVVSISVPQNEKSLAVMRRLGMKPDRRAGFDHPFLPEGHPLRPRVVWRARSQAVAKPVKAGKREGKR